MLRLTLLQVGRDRLVIRVSVRVISARIPVMIEFMFIHGCILRTKMTDVRGSIFGKTLQLVKRSLLIDLHHFTLQLPKSGFWYRCPCVAFLCVERTCIGYISICLSVPFMTIYIQEAKARGREVNGLSFSVPRNLSFSAFIHQYRGALLPCHILMPL